jgi:hypothetical protein
MIDGIRSWAREWPIAAATRGNFPQSCELRWYATNAQITILYTQIDIDAAPQVHGTCRDRRASIALEPWISGHATLLVDAARL